MKYSRPQVLRVEANGAYIQCYINGNPVIAEYDYSFKVGKIGFITYKVRASFCDLNVWAPCAPQEVCCPAPALLPPPAEISQAMPVEPAAEVMAHPEWRSIGQKPCCSASMTKFYY